MIPQRQIDEIRMRQSERKQWPHGEFGARRKALIEDVDTCLSMLDAIPQAGVSREQAFELIDKWVEGRRRTLRDEISALDKAALVYSIIITLPRADQAEVDALRKERDDFEKAACAMNGEFNNAAERAETAEQALAAARAQAAMLRERVGTEVAEKIQIIESVYEECRKETYEDIEPYLENVIHRLCKTNPKIIEPFDCLWPKCGCKERGDWPPGLYLASIPSTSAPGFTRYQIAACMATEQWKRKHPDALVPLWSFTSPVDEEETHFWRKALISADALISAGVVTVREE